MERNHLLWLAAGMTSLSLAARAQQPQRPNVIIIYADDLGYGDLSCYGATRVSTPHIDQLAAEGCRFTNAHAVAATSTPSRYSLLTGEYSWRREGTDIARGDAGMIIRPEQYTMADLFRNAGYATGAFGKWHLGLGDKTGKQDWNAPLPTGLADIGFDYSYIMAATADRVPCVFIENGQVANYDPTAPITVSYEHPIEGEPTGKEHPELCYNQQSAFGHNQAIVNGIGRIGYMKGGGRALWKDEHLADSIVDHALRFIRQHRSEPFFMYLATNDIHVPRFPSDRFRGKSPMGVRGDVILQLDWTVGEVMRELKRLKLDNNTLIVFSSDNGPVVNDGYADRAEELLGDHSPAGPLRGNKYSAFEGGTRVPVIVRWPGKVTAGQESGALLSQIDLFATFAHLLGARMPHGAAPDSQNSADAWTGKDSQGRAWVVEQALNHTLSLRTPQWKYIEPCANPYPFMQLEKVETGYGDRPQLYKVDDDIRESTDVAEQHPSVVFDLQKLMREIQGKRPKK